MNASTALDAEPMPTIMMIGITSATVGVALSIRIGNSTAFHPACQRPRTTLMGAPMSRANRAEAQRPERDERHRARSCLHRQSRMPS